MNEARLEYESQLQELRKASAEEKKKEEVVPEEVVKAKKTTPKKKEVAEEATEEMKKAKAVAYVNDLYRIQDKLRKEILARERMINRTQDSGEVDRLREINELLRSSVLTKEELANFDADVGGGTKINDTLKEEVAYRAQIQQIEADRKKKEPTKQDGMDALYKEQKKNLGDIKTLLDSIYKSERQGLETTELNNQIEALEKKRMSLEQIEAMSMDTDPYKYSVFATSYLNISAAIDMAREKLSLLSAENPLSGIKKDFDKVIENIDKFKTDFPNATPGDAKNKFFELQDIVKRLSADLQGFGKDTPGFDALQKEIDETLAGMERMGSSFLLSEKGLTNKAVAEQTLTQMGRTFSSYTKRIGLQVLRSAFREATVFAREFGDTLNDIQIVTLKSDDEINKLGESYVRLAKSMSLTSVDVSKSASALYRQGLGDDEVQERLVQASRFAKVAAIDITEAVDIITVAINTGMVGNAQRATDVLVALGDAAATDSRLVA